MHTSLCKSAKHLAAEADYMHYDGVISEDEDIGRHLHYTGVDPRGNLVIVAIRVQNTQRVQSPSLGSNHPASLDESDHFRFRGVSVGMLFKLELDFLVWYLNC